MLFLIIISVKVISKFLSFVYEKLFCFDSYVYKNSFKSDMFFCKYLNYFVIFKGKI